MKDNVEGILVSSRCFPGGKVVKNPSATVGDGFNPWIRKIPGEGNGNLLQYSSLENFMDREAWQGLLPWGCE